MSKRMTQKCSILNWMSLWQCYMRLSEKANQRPKNETARRGKDGKTRSFSCIRWHQSDIGMETELARIEKKQQRRWQQPILHWMPCHRKNECTEKSDHMRTSLYQHVITRHHHHQYGNKKKCESITGVKSSSGLVNCKHHETAIDKVLSPYSCFTNKIRDKEKIIDCACTVYAV